VERRFEERKREIEQDAKIDKKALAGSVRRLQQFGQPYFEHFRRSETRENAQIFLEGLLSDLPRKNVESIAYRYEQDRQALQRFVGQTDWDHKPLLKRLAEQVGKEIGEDDGILVFDPSGFEKDGKISAGVARQWLGRFGKVDNGQVGTFMAYVTRQEHVLVNAKLFIPQEWNDNPARCKRARIPEKEYKKHKTRHQHCLEMYKEQGKLLPHKWVAGDDELGRSSPFRRALRKRKVKYVLAVPCNTTVLGWELLNTVSVGWGDDQWAYIWRDGGMVHQMWDVDKWGVSAVTPEPATLAMIGLGLAGLGYARRRQMMRATAA